MANYITKFNTVAEYEQATLNYPNVSLITSDMSVVYQATEPTPPMSNCSIIIPQPIASYTSTEYPSVFSVANNKWYMKNNLDQYEEYGIYETGASLASFTSYEGKLVAVGTTEYQSINGVWTEVGVYEDNQTTYTFTNSTTAYNGQTIPITSFKVPKVDVENLIDADEMGEGAELVIYGSNNDELVVRTQSFPSIGLEATYWTENEEYYATVTDDGNYFNVSFASQAETPITITISSVNTFEWSGQNLPLRMVIGSTNITVEYPTKAAPSVTAYQTVEAMEEVGCPNVSINEYALVGEDLYKYSADEEWVQVPYTDAKFVVKTSNSIDVHYNNGSSTLTYKEIQVYQQISTSPIEITIGDSVITVGDSVFEGCSKCTSLTFGNNVTSIGEYAFSTCIMLVGLNIPDSVTTIGDSAFQNIKNDFTIGSGITSIEGWAFSNYNSGRYSMTIKAVVPPTVDTNAFRGAVNIYVPSESVNAYKTASGWSAYADKIQPIIA